MRAVHRAMATTALVLGLGASVAGDPIGPVGGGAAVLAAAQRPVPRVGAVELARWIRDRRPGLRVVDLRSRAEFDAFHVPGSSWVRLEELLEDQAPAELETLVLVGRGIDAAAAWPLLHATGRHARVLDGGIDGWIAEVMDPVLPAGADPTLEARFDSLVELSRYFGGNPRRARAGEAVVTPWARDHDSSAERVLDELRVRGGCTW